MTDPLQRAESLAPRFAARAADHDRDAAFPAADIEDIRAAGLLGLMVPQRLGGMGAGFEDYTRVACALARGNASTALIFNMHASITGMLATVPEDLARGLGVPDSFFDHRDRVLREAASGSIYGVAISERGSGGRISKVQSTYARTDGGYRLQGQKSVCTGAGHLDGYLFAARAEDSAPQDDPRVSYFLVPGAAVRDVGDAWDPVGMRATASNGFALDTTVAAETLVGGVEGLSVMLAYALPQWLVASYAAVYVGVAQAALDEAAVHIGRRDLPGDPGGLTKVGFIRGRLGRADAQVEAARLALEHAGHLADIAPVDPRTIRAAYRAKLLAGDAALEVASTCTEAAGLAALRRGSPLERLYRDARCGALQPPSSDVCADVLGTAVLGLDPFTGSDVSPW